MDEKQNRISDLLPQIFTEYGDDKTKKYIQRFLKPAEKLFQSRDITDPAEIERGLIERLEKIPALFQTSSGFWHPESPATDEFNHYFTVQKKEFLEWFASWFDFTLEEGVAFKNNLNVLSRLILIYKKRGTIQGIKEAIEVFDTGANVIISDMEEPGSSGISTPYLFEIMIILNIADYVKLKEVKDLIVKIIEREKPAHVSYRVDWKTTFVFTIGVEDSNTGISLSRVGITTMIGDEY